MPELYQFDAYRAQDQLRERYANFLLETFGVRREPLLSLLRENWTERSATHDRLFAPLLVQGAFPFRPGQTVQELQAPKGAFDGERPLHPKTVRLLQKAGIDYRLYEHQVEAIRAGREGKTVVLSAGTGSGKTEAFLIPLIDRLFWDHDEGRDNLASPGVRALVVYPLNALVNNQVDRLLELMEHQDEIRFAFYTSRLKESRKAAENLYVNKGREIPASCQIIDRQTLRGLSSDNSRPNGPPHILVTNFAMLEYMLIRPLDRTIFSPQCLYHNGYPRLKMMVLDEAHVYGGAQADEIHMLLRRAAQRFGTTLDTIQGYATSATLSSEEALDGVNPLKQYAGEMFSTPAEQVASIIGHRYLPSTGAESGPLRNPDLVSPEELDQSPIDPGLRTLEYDEHGKIAGFVHDPEMAGLAIKASKKLHLIDDSSLEAIDAIHRDCPARLLFQILSTHQKMVELREWLFAREDQRLPDLDEVARFLFASGEITEAHRRAAESILRIASLARSEPRELPFIPIRMHLMVRAPQGVWVDINPETSRAKPEAEWPWGQLQSVPPIEKEGMKPVAELLLCKECGTPYLGAWQTRDRFGDASVQTFPSQGSQPLVFWSDPSSTQQLPPDWGGARVRIFSAKGKEAICSPRTIDRCRCCGEEEAELEALQFSPRAAQGALIDGIYPFLSEFPASDHTFRPGNGRRLLTFSDSRQGAARVASTVEDSHDTGVNRQILYRVLSQEQEDEDSGIRGKDLIDALIDSRWLRERAIAQSVNPDNIDLMEDLAQISIYQEFGRPPARGNTLETLGLVEVQYPRLPRKPAEIEFLTSQEWKDFLSDMVDDIRRRGAVKSLRVSEESKRYQLNDLIIQGINRKMVWTVAEFDGSRESKQDGGSTVGLLPSEETHWTKSRLFHYADRVLKSVQAPAGWDPVRLLRLGWDALTGENQPKWLKTIRPDGEHSVYQVLPDHLIYRPYQRPPFIHPHSGRVYFRSLRGVLPEVSQSADLIPLDDHHFQTWKDRHAIRRVVDEEILGLWTVEHTAQLDVESLEDQERNFREGKRNLLASSTTMEMGIDLGGLTFVLLTNVPPGPANYWQRAGRAGRRADGSSMVLTLALARPHDQKVFSNPHGFLHDKIVPPRVRLSMAPLLFRHVRALFLTEFFDQVVEPGKAGNPMRSFGNVGAFLFTPLHEGSPGPGIRQAAIRQYGFRLEETLADAFLHWLQELNSEHLLAEKLTALLKGTELEGHTLEALCTDTRKAFSDAISAALEDMKAIDIQRERQEERGAGAVDKSLLNALRYQERLLKADTVISYLARRGFLPRFGFPLSVVKLDTNWEIKESRKNGHRDAYDDSDREQSIVPDLRMERALDLALSEYVPGAEVVAAKRIHRVQGLVRNWHDEESVIAHRRFYLECLKCGHTDDRAAAISACPVCKHPTMATDDFVEQAALQSRKKNGDDSLVAEDGLRPPSPLRWYLEPRGFAVQAGVPPERVTRSPQRMPSATIKLAQSPPEFMEELIEGQLASGFREQERVFIRSEGNPDRTTTQGFGYAICQYCGFSLPEVSWDKPLPDKFRGHLMLRGKNRCPSHAKPWRHAVLGTSMPVDVFRVRLLGDLAPQGLNTQSEEGFYLTFAVLLLQVAARRLQVDPRTFQPLVGTWRRYDTEGFRREAVLYEESGSGMLERLQEHAIDMIRDVVDLLEMGDEADFIRFDTQFLASQGQLRLDLLRQHFSSEKCRQILSGVNLFEKHGLEMLRHQSLRRAAFESIDDWSRDLAMQTPFLGEDFSENESVPGSRGERGLMDVVMARQKRHSVNNVRLLLGRLPFQDPANTDELRLARQLFLLIEAGLQVRILPSLLDEGVQWPFLSRKTGTTQALSNLESIVGFQEEIRAPLGGEWLSTATPVRARTSKADEEWHRFEERWNAAEEPLPEQVWQEPSRGSAHQNWNYVLVPAGKTEPNFINLPTFLETEGGLEDLRSLGQVQRILYLDRYVIRGTIPMWNLRQLLLGFSYADHAQGHIVTLEDRNAPQVFRDLSADEWYDMHNVDQALPLSAMTRIQEDCQQALLENGLHLHFDISPDYRTPHTRKLLVEFAPGSQLDSLKITFDHGLDWMQTARGKTFWRKHGLKTQNCEVYIFRNPDLEAETDVYGKVCLWKRYFA